MDVVFIPGAMRMARDLASFAERVPGSVVVNLPGHGGEPIIPPSVEAYARHFEQRLAEASVIVGESLGGTVALAMRTKAVVIALDPPISSVNFGTVRRQFRLFLAKHPSPALEEFAYRIFGLSLTGETEARDYLPLVRAGHVLAATEDSLLSPRDVIGLVERGVSIEPIVGSHALIDSAPDAVETAIRRLSCPSEPSESRYSRYSRQA